MDQYETLPVVPLRNVVVFPHMMMPFVIGRPSSTRALEHALATDKKIFLAAQHDESNDDPQPADIYTMGCVANIVQSLKLPDGNIKVLVEGVERARAMEWKEDKGFFRVTVKVMPRKTEPAAEAEAVMSRVVSLFEQYIKLSNNLQYDAMVAAVRVDDPSRLADTIAAHLQVGIEEKQNLLEIVAPVERLSRIVAVLEAEVDKLQVDRRIQSRVKKQMEKAQKEYYLNEKMKAIQRELGRKDEKGNETDDLKKKIEQARMPKDVERKAVDELKRLEAMPPMSAEATVSRNYLDWLIAVPWHKKTKESRDLKRAEEILHEDGEPDGLERDRLAAGVGAGDEQRRAGGDRDVVRDAAALGEQHQRMARVEQRDARRLVDDRLGRDRVVGHDRGGGDHVERLGGGERRRERIGLLGDPAARTRRGCGAPRRRPRPRRASCGC